MMMSLLGSGDCFDDGMPEICHTTIARQWHLPLLACEFAGL